ncbi:Alpha/Beta hydrolase protein [Ephemerocybe angulata]|uniref:Alpha/Beta hydrolase protein n=1 Tax=Ephemerocybe angulata TaxID=980116 RepID=A0A8H6HZD5_9AGAR|nr:Alpha/Beta hydrolase protein [Tulosesus angulatus]
MPTNTAGPEIPYTINVTEEELGLLKKKLELLTDAGSDYGAPLVDIEKLVARWKGGYDWKKHEAILNAELPQFTRMIAIDGFGELDIHYVHKQSEVKSAIPLLFVHGWPGSFIEVRKILPLLIAPSEEHPSFHVVAFSLPGFGFSSNPTKRGFSLDQYAEVGYKLMLALGYNEYVTQGGDWGYHILRRHAHNKAWHTNYPHARRYEGHFTERYDTLPVGLLSWIYEKLVNWSDDYPWEEDEVLTWVSIYWFSRSGYKEEETHIPMGYSYFPKELWRVPSKWLQAPNLVFEAEHPEGGHFAAHEKPDYLVGDLRKMFGKGGPAFGVVPGKTGYAAK